MPGRHGARLRRPLPVPPSQGAGHRLHKALALPGVLAVLTVDDVPHNKVGHLQQDWDVMIA